MSDDLAEWFKNRAQEEKQRKQEEYDNLIRLLKERVEEENAKTNNLPKFFVRGSVIQLEHYELHLEFDQVFHSPTDHVLVAKGGLAPHKKPLFGSEPPRVSHTLQPKVSNDLSSVMWTHKLGNLAPFTSAELVEFVLDMLTGFYLRHKRN